MEEIANSDNILLFRREKQAKKVESKATRKTREALKKPMEPDELERTNVEDLVSTILELPGSRLELLSGKTLGEALEEYVEKNNLQSIPNASEHLLKKRQKKLISQTDVTGSAEDIKDAIRRESYGEPAEAVDHEEPEVPKSNATKTGSKSRSRKQSFSSGEDVNADDYDDEDEENMGNKRSRKSSSSTSRKPIKAKAPAASRRKHQPPSDDEEDDDVVILEEKPKSKSRSSRRSTKKVNYSVDDDDDDGDESDAVVDMLDDDDDDDDEVMEIEPPKKSRKATTTARSSRTAKKSPPRRTTKATSTRKPSRRKFVDSDDDDDDLQPSIGLADDWGSAATSSQYRR